MSYPRRNAVPEPNYEDLRRELGAGKLPNVILMYGPEAYLIRWLTGLITEKYVNEAAKVFDYTAVDAYSLDTVSGIIEACEMMPMMSEKRIVRVTDMNPKCADLPALAAYLESVPDTTILMFIQSEKSTLGAEFNKALAKAGKAYEFGRVDRKTLGGFIKKYLKQTGTAFDQQAIDALIEVSGYYDKDSEHTLDNIMADIAKVAAHSSGRVTAEDVAETVIGNVERDVFAFTDALTAGNKAEAMRLLRVLLSYGGSGSEFNLLGLICSQFETMMLIAEANEQRKPASLLSSELKLNAYRVKLLGRSASRYSSAQLKRILMKAYEIDRNVKTGVMEAALGLELFVAGV